MLGAASVALDPRLTELRLQRLEHALPEGPFDLVVSVLAVHHLDADGKADLVARVRDALVPGGRFVLGDLVVPEDPADVVTEIDGVIDVPDPLADQLRRARRRRARRRRPLGAPGPGRGRGDAALIPVGRAHRTRPVRIPRSGPREPALTSTA